MDFEFRILLYVCFLCFLFILYAYFVIVQYIDLDFRSMRHIKINIIIVPHLALSSEQEILREELTCLQTSKERMKKRVTELEEEVKKYKEELDKALKRASAQPEDEVSWTRH